VIVLFRLLEEFKNKLDEKLGNLICKIYIFGEYARGNYNEDPELKVAVIVKRKLTKGEWGNIETIAMNIGEKYNKFFTVYEIELDKFEAEKSPLAKIVKREGFELTF